MRHVKLFEQFVLESNNVNITNIMLNKLEPSIQEMLGRIKTWYLEKFQHEMTEYDLEMSRLNLILDMVKSVEKYTASGDILISLNSSTSAKGNIEISAQIQRGDQVYQYDTEVIYAGGYNIQQLHYRYITKTKLPQTGLSELTKVYQDRIKKMSKLEKLNSEIDSLQKRIDQNNEKIATNSAFSDKQIMAMVTSSPGFQKWPTWEEIVQNGAAKNFDNDERQFNAEKQKSIDELIPRWKRKNIGWAEDHNKDLTKEVERLKRKLEQAIDLSH